MRSIAAIFILAVVAGCSAEIYFAESFDDGENWAKRWTIANRDGYGSFNLSHGDKFLDDIVDIGIRTTEDFRHYAVSAKFSPFSNAGRDFVFQFNVKNEQIMRCGGSYLKLLSCGFEQSEFGPDTEYLVMFGPDICGPEHRRLHVILAKRGSNFPLKRHLKYPLDKLTHQYTLILRPDNSFEVLIDNRRVERGTIDQDFGILPPMKIDDPEAKKPELWDDREFIDDPSSLKPEDWVEEKYVPDPDALKPDDWDEAIDGIWEPPMIENPVYQGPWTPQQMKNPAYDGKWTPPKIPNPEYEPDSTLYTFPEICAVGLEVWQVEAGSIFDNILLTDDANLARKLGEETWRPRMERERELNDEAEKLQEELEGNFDNEEDSMNLDQEMSEFQSMTRGEPVKAEGEGDDETQEESQEQAKEWGLEDKPDLTEAEDTQQPEFPDFDYPIGEKPKGAKEEL
ncbi:unnamed protein product [Notodromas monacha]|uniref:Calreticulin n=1 Tax=Notodromas monacha TaxID=399045 RepID=A0A7R9GDC7_9CRUS|nr:unnamed protein product [Notodromas monacha]CAG0918548.1 unnamed protein product [Notodromas monacha]